MGTFSAMTYKGVSRHGRKHGFNLYKIERYFISPIDAISELDL